MRLISLVPAAALPLCSSLPAPALRARVKKLTGGNFEVTTFSPKYSRRGTLRRERGR